MHENFYHYFRSIVFMKIVMVYLLLVLIYLCHIKEINSC